MTGEAESGGSLNPGFQVYPRQFSETVFLKNCVCMYVEKYVHIYIYATSR